MTTFQCGSCRKLRDRNGSSMRTVLGVMMRVCLGCRTSIDTERKIMPKCKRNPKRDYVIGAGGKRVRPPTGIQAKFTVGGGVVHVSKVAGYPGRDVRFTVDPEEFKGGDFMAEWRKLRGHE